MKKKLLLGAVLAGAVATGPIVALHITTLAAPWHPIEHGLTATPEDLLPATISTTQPVRVVSTVLDDAGRPVITAHTATDRAAAGRLITSAQHARHAVGVELDGIVTAATVPTGSDDYRAQQWDLDMMRVPEAWPSSTGERVTVAVIDTGVDASHPDLAGQVLPGADFLTGVEGTAIDPNGHGTHVAGVIAAATGNGTGIAGVAPDARILPIRVLGANGSGYLSDTANGIVYAAEHGADVINMSLSSTSDLDAVDNAIGYARSRGVVVVVAAGNMRGQGSPVCYPAAVPGVIAVAASDSADRIAPFSNRGGYVDVAAPGYGILSTFPAATGSGYRQLSGTSMAAPHVAGLAALIRGANPKLTPDEVEQVIEETAADRGAPGRDDDFGYGRVDAAAALAQVTKPAETAPPTPAAQPTETTPPTEATPSEAPTSAAAPAPSETTPSETGTTEPTPTPSEPTSTPSEPSPTPSEPAPTRGDTGGSEPTSAPAPGEPAPTSPAAPAPAISLPPVRTWLVHVSATQLTIVLDGLDEQTVQLQRRSGDIWTTELTYPATRVVRLNGLVPGLAYRVVVPPSARFAGAVSAPVEM